VRLLGLVFEKKINTLSDQALKAKATDTVLHINTFLFRIKRKKRLPDKK
jgi:hypothetical protein